MVVAGVVRTEATLLGGERWGTSRGYLHPALGRSNLHVTEGAHVTKVREVRGRKGQLRSLSETRGRARHQSERGKKKRNKSERPQARGRKFI